VLRPFLVGLVGGYVTLGGWVLVHVTGIVR
jgi:hypothetical protein